VNRMRDSLVTADELEIVKRRLIEGFPSQFSTSAAIAGVLAAEEATGRYEKDPNYFTEYRDRVAAVNISDVSRVAKRLLDPAKATVVVVGNAEEISIGDPKHDAKLSTLAGGEPMRLPLRDPMTMQPLVHP
jgi:zinc protease